MAWRWPILFSAWGLRAGTLGHIGLPSRDLFFPRPGIDVTKRRHGTWMVGNIMYKPVACFQLLFCEFSSLLTAGFSIRSSTVEGIDAYTAPRQCHCQRQDEGLPIDLRTHSGGTGIGSRGRSEVPKRCGMDAVSTSPSSSLTCLPVCRARSSLAGRRGVSQHHALHPGQQILVGSTGRGASAVLRDSKKHEGGLNSHEDPHVAEHTLHRQERRAHRLRGRL